MDDPIRKLIQSIFDEHQDADGGCDSCNAQLHCLVELVARGAAIGQLLPAVEAHLACCADCNEEFEALLVIMRAEMQGLTLIKAGASSSGGVSDNRPS